MSLFVRAQFRFLLLFAGVLQQLRPTERKEGRVTVYVNNHDACLVLQILGVFIDTENLTMRKSVGGKERESGSV